MTRLRQVPLLIRPTARVLGWGPPLWATVPAAVYVGTEAPGAFVDYRVQVLRLGAVLLCMGAAFILDDPTEETLGHVPTPLVLRRGLRVMLAIPLLACAWIALLLIAGRVARRDGGPLPVADLTLEVTGLLLITLLAACVAARVTSDRLGGVVAAPIALVCAAVAMLLPGDLKLLLPSVSDPRWDQVHHLWALGLVGGGGAFLLVNGSPGAAWKARGFLTKR